MQRLRFTAILTLLATVFAVAPAASYGTTVVVDGLSDVAGVSYANLSGAVSYVQSTGSGPHTINITTNQTSGPEGQIYITTPITIEGDADNDGNKCDILVDLDGIQLGTTTNIGGPNKAFLEVQTSGTVTIRNLKIHPDSDATATGATNAVNGIQLFRPLIAGELANYTLEAVWVSGSDSANAYVNLDTSTDLHDAVGVKRWSREVSAGTAANGDAFASIVISNSGAGNVVANITNSHAGLSRSTALSIIGGSTAYTTATVTGGLYGHSMRDGIHVEGNKDFTFVTIKGTPTNRLRVLRTPHQTGKDAHGLEIDGVTAQLVEYVDSECMSSGNSFKFAGTGIANLVRYCRALGKFDSGANSTVYVTGGFQLPDFRDSTFVGSGSDLRPIQVSSGSAGDVQFTNTIFVSDNLGAIGADNLDTLNGIQSLTNCAIPTDGTSSESLNITTPIINPAGSFLPVPTSPINSSPAFLATRAAYDWSEAAVSITGANLSAGNPNVLRPGNPAYASAGFGGSALVGGAGPAAPSGVNEWAIY